MTSNLLAHIAILVSGLLLLSVTILADKQAILGQNSRDTMKVPSFSDRDLLEYANPSLGIRLLYPPDWEVHRSGGTVEFVSPLENSSDIFREKLVILIKPLTSKNASLQGLTEANINYLRQNFANFHLIRSFTTSIDNNLASETVYTMIEGQHQHIIISVMAIKDDNVYIITTGAESNKFHYYLSIIQKMLSSFKTIQDVDLTTESNQTRTNKVDIAPNAGDPHNRFHFNPPSIVVPVGTTVIWTNKDYSDHTFHTVASGEPITDPNHEFYSGILAPGKTFKHKFDKRGTFEYFCTLHAFKSAEIVVK
jgi:plastocyanin